LSAWTKDCSQRTSIQCVAEGWLSFNFHSALPAGTSIFFLLLYIVWVISPPCSPPPTPSSRQVLFCPYH
jgi:hypothetical protein